MKIESASQTRTKPIQRPAGMSSPSTVMPSANCRIGARYCSRPSDVIVSRVAAPLNSSSGIAVTTPADISSSTWPMPSDVKCESPVVPNQARKQSANGAISVVSKARLSIAPTPAVFFASP